MLQPVNIERILEDAQVVKNILSLAPGHVTSQAYSTSSMYTCNTSFQ